MRFSGQFFRFLSLHKNDKRRLKRCIIRKICDNSSHTLPPLFKPVKPVGIVGYGGLVPRYRLPAKGSIRVWTGGKGRLPIKEKAVPGLDEDVITMSIEAARNAMKRADRSA